MKRNRDASTTRQQNNVGYNDNKETSIRKKRKELSSFLKKNKQKLQDFKMMLYNSIVKSLEGKKLTPFKVGGNEVCNKKKVTERS